MRLYEEVSLKKGGNAMLFFQILVIVGTKKSLDPMDETFSTV
tara:strand:+ start:460 stop:585 length:126 start_codon:yes stop_codon:yes gene_type:complete